MKIHATAINWQNIFFFLPKWNNIVLREKKLYFHSTSLDVHIKDTYSSPFLWRFTSRNFLSFFLLFWCVSDLFFCFHSPAFYSICPVWEWGKDWNSFRIISAIHRMFCSLCIATEPMNEFLDYKRLNIMSLDRILFCMWSSDRILTILYKDITTGLRANVKLTCRAGESGMRFWVPEFKTLLFQSPGLSCFDYRIQIHIT